VDGKPDLSRLSPIRPDDCIISGIRPQIAQTIVHLGLQLDVISKATMADAFALALKRTAQVVSSA
jgi:rsbT co-antagonist protein RsbR